MAVWTKDNGQKITLNDEPATIEHAESLGWKKAKKTVKKSVKKAAKK